MTVSKPWQCPGCKTWYAPFIDKCACEKMKLKTNEYKEPAYRFYPCDYKSLTDPYIYNT
jgi:hypothetical protein